MAGTGKFFMHLLSYIESIKISVNNHTMYAEQLMHKSGNRWERWYERDKWSLHVCKHTVRLNGKENLLDGLKKLLRHS